LNHAESRYNQLQHQRFLHLQWRTTNLKPCDLPLPFFYMEAKDSPVRAVQLSSSRGRGRAIESRKERYRQGKSDTTGREGARGNRQARSIPVTSKERAMDTEMNQMSERSRY
jgi:hypothetical protein